MKKEYHEDTDSTWVSYGAGRAFDDYGSPMPFWRARAVYTWSQYRQMYWVYTVQVVGLGMVDDSVTRETEMGSLRDVHHYLRYLQDMETCYQKVYGE